MKQNFTRLLGLICVIALAAMGCILFCRGKLTVSAVLSWLPRRAPLAVLLFMGLYLAKSLSFFFPLAVLQTAGGAVFPFFPAVLLNLCGTAAAMALPWLLGWRSSRGLARIQQRFPVLKKAQALRPSSDFLYTLFLRAAGCFPFDAVSFYLGALKIAPVSYLLAGLLGCLPQLLLATALGAGLTKPLGGALPAAGIVAAACVAALAVRRIVKTRTK